jgi:hypothetical protein
MHCRFTLIPIPSISFAALATSAADLILFPQVSNLKFYLGRRRRTSFVLSIGQASTSRAGGNGIYRTQSPVRSSRPQRLAEKRPPGQKPATVTRSRFGRIDQPRSVTQEMSLLSGRARSPACVTLSRTRKRVLRVSDARFAPRDDFCTVWHIFDLLPGGPEPDHRPVQYRDLRLGLSATEIAELRHGGVI